MKDTVEEQPVESIEDAIGAAFDEAEQGDEIEEQEEVVEPIEEPAEESEVEDEEEVEESEDDAEEGPKEEKLDPPEHWSAADKEVFSKQSKEGQEFLLRRHKEMEADYTRKSQDIAKDKRQMDSIKDALEPYRHQFERSGLDYAGAVRQLASWDSALRTGGRDALMQLAQAYQINLSEPESDEYIDPQVKQLQDQVKQMQTLTSQQMQAAQQARQKQVSDLIQTFRDEKDETGNLRHPHFESLKDDITALFNAGLATDLKSGYQKALAMRPDLQIVKETPKVDQAERVRKAKKAATGVKSSGAVAKKNRDSMSLEQEIASYF